MPTLSLQFGVGGAKTRSHFFQNQEDKCTKESRSRNCRDLPPKPDPVIGPLCFLVRGFLSHALPLTCRKLAFVC